MVNFLGFQWHTYGLLLGLSIWLGWELVAYQARWHRISLVLIQQLLPGIILGGVVGARLYHVVTDWPIYAARPWEAFYIWHGGLSIIGAVIGGGLVLTLGLKLQRHWQQLPLYLDLSVFGLPVAQALGRLGNYVNHELYGRPTTLPWAVTIEPQFRLAQYQQFSRYHPLFAYEMITLLVFGLYTWWLARHKRGPELGSGIWFASYLAYYALVRFMLDFLRIDTAYLGNTAFTINQVVMSLVFIGAVSYSRKKSRHV